MSELASDTLSETLPKLVVLVGRILGLGVGVKKLDHLAVDMHDPWTAVQNLCVRI